MITTTETLSFARHARGRMVSDQSGSLRQRLRSTEISDASQMFMSMDAVSTKITDLLHQIRLASRSK
jgi:hypothetical protein